LQVLKFVPNLTTTDLADALGIDQTTATRTLALIKKSGLVIDTRGSDRRERRWALTSAGETTFRRLKPKWEAAQAAFEITMTSSKLIKTSNRSLVLLSAAFLLQTGGALAAARAGDAQTQARELVSQTTAGRPVAAQSNALPDGISPAALDPQEQARRVLLGARSAGGEAEVAAPRYAKSTSSAGVVGRDHSRAHSDAQEMARRMILGTVI